MINIGESLVRARRSRALELDDAAKATRLSEHYLRALEEERFGDLPPGGYRSGFLRTYADFLGLDADQLVDEYRARHERPRRMTRTRVASWRSGRHP